jgi:hypothetical protein
MREQQKWFARTSVILEFGIGDPCGCGCVMDPSGCKSPLKQWVEASQFQRDLDTFRGWPNGGSDGCERRQTSVSGSKIGKHRRKFELLRFCITPLLHGPIEHRFGESWDPAPVFFSADFRGLATLDVTSA